jgi:hypothetical protein
VHPSFYGERPFLAGRPAQASRVDQLEQLEGDLLLAQARLDEDAVVPQHQQQIALGEGAGEG